MRQFPWLRTHTKQPKGGHSRKDSGTTDKPTGGQGLPLSSWRTTFSAPLMPKLIKCRKKLPLPSRLQLPSCTVSLAAGILRFVCPDTAKCSENEGYSSCQGCEICRRPTWAKKHELKKHKQK